MTTAIIYTRFSPRPNANDCTSCEKQAERCERYCKQQGYDVMATWSDRAVSGGELDRPDLNRAIESLKDGMVLVVDRADRLARDLLVDLTIRHQITQRGATVEFADGSPHDTTPEGKLLQAILAAFAAYERDRIRARTSAGLRKKQAAGMWLGKPPIGYRLEGGKLVEASEEQEILREIRRLANPPFNCSSETIAYELNHRPVMVNLRGRPWSARTIRRILAREADRANASKPASQME